MASPFTFRTKPTGPHATFSYDCPRCRQEATVTNAKPDPHTCTEPRPLTLEQLRAALDNR
jgi:hypothetical protein